ncbi:hypothetical protein HYR99_06720 [Candidatus Poribacteria bacterium]|nr:hypothetical protein [Candidatus Poribacteria bacterium]
MKQKRKDLVVVTADIQQKRTVATLLLERWQSLGIRQLAIDVDSDIFSLQNDPKVYHEGGRFLSTFARQYEYALVLIDAKWDGGHAGADEIERKIQGDLDRSGWEGRSAVVVLEPELEIWVWSQSPHVPQLFGTNWQTIQNLGHRTGYWQEGATKPSRPQELLETVLRHTGKRRSVALFVQLARKVGLKACQDESFRRFCTILQQWFPV